MHWKRFHKTLVCSGNEVGVKSFRGRNNYLFCGNLQNNKASTYLLELIEAMMKIL